jgi:hypothetical protein
LTITVLDAEPRRIKKLRLDLPQPAAISGGEAKADAAMNI